ncbi:MAG: hypothetical protein WCI94_17285 [Rhodospirillales bacterium]
MRLLTFLRSPLALPLVFAVSMAAWLANAASIHVPKNEDRGMIWVYVGATCAEAGNPSDCHPDDAASVRAFDTREACAAHLNADLARAANPRYMGSCLRQHEA